jgi:hypothetical protein
VVTKKGIVFLDTNIFTIDLRYQRDLNYRINRGFLEKVRTDRNGKISVFNLLELCGILSFNLNKRQLDNLFHYFSARYSINVFPENYLILETMHFGMRQLFEIISKKLSFANALLLQHIESHFPRISAFITWDADHFKGKSPLQVLTPEAYLSQIQ